MKNRMALILLVTYLFTCTPVKELVKLPVLVSHYQEHAQQSPGMTWWQFFEMHYLHGIVYDEDYSRDMQLPFKTVDFSGFPVLVSCDEKKMEINLSQGQSQHDNEVPAMYKDFITQATLHGIFHPPQHS